MLNINTITNIIPVIRLISGLALSLSLSLSLSQWGNPSKTDKGYPIPIRATLPKSAKSPPTKQLLHKSQIRPPKNIKDRLKILSPQKTEQQKPQIPIGKVGKIQLNTKINNERQRRPFKLPSTKLHTISSASRTKSTIRINKQCNV